MNTPKEKPAHLAILDPLRGAAAFSVCVFHFAGSHGGLFPEDGVAHLTASFGRHGVEAFYAISGFVLPYSLYARGYRLSEFMSFLVRRIKRIEPPYFASIALVLALAFIGSHVPGYRGPEFEIDWRQLLAHVGYLTALLGGDWYSAVYWTLAIEFQYYLFVGLVYPLIGSTRGWPAVISVIFVGGIGLFAPVVEQHANPYLPHWLPIFALGMATFQHVASSTNLLQFSASIFVIGSVALVVDGAAGTVAALFVCLTVVLSRSRPLPRLLAPAVALGAMSYSLYLVHLPIGGRVMSLASRLPEGVASRWAALLVAIAASLLAARLFWRFVEVPSQRWSQSAPRTCRRSSPPSASAP